MIFGLYLSGSSDKHFRARALEGGLLRPLSSNFRSELTSEAAMASEAIIMAIPGNMHLDARVIGVAFFKSEIIFDLQGH